MTLPSWVPAGHKQAPMPLLLVQAFVNTRDLDLGTDLLAEPRRGREWLRECGLLATGVGLAAADLDTAREIRESIRALLAPGGELGPGDGLAPLHALAGAGRPRLAVDPAGRVELAAGPASNLTEGLLSLLVIIRDAQRDGSWAQLKVCGNPDCQWVFFDRSHSRRGSWCDMSSCGNLMKNRNLRARRRAG